ncbi:hypothetical protein [Streptomyces sp. NPDC006335]|uniref:hypothetical protein n=1 Tax=Streptomyces sp. NPDC006335 TaxID=3156895 RepID=UPI0033AEDE81
MSRLSRDKKRDHQRGAAPIDVHVPLAGESATVAGTPVTAPPGEELHQTVLTHLHDLARTSGHPVHATIHDARIGYVVPLEVATDGASRFTAEPVRMAPRGPAEQGDRPEPSGEGEEPVVRPWPPAAPAAPEGTGYVVPLDVAPSAGRFTAEPVRKASQGPAEQGDRPEPSGAGEEPVARPWPPAAPAAPHERPTRLLRRLDDPAQDPAPAFRPPNPPEPQPTDTEAPPTQVLRKLPDPQATGPAPAQAPGTVVPPTGEFGPPPVMDSIPSSTPAPQPPTDLACTSGPLPPTGPVRTPSGPQSGPVHTPATPASGTPASPPPSDPGPGREAEAEPAPTPMPTSGFAAVVPQPLPSAAPAPRTTAPLIDPVPLLDDPGREPTPVRGFDAVAEALLGEGLVVEESAVLAEPVGRISEAVREGRTDVAAELAEQVVGEASETLGAEHPDVLRVRELAAYIAYLGGEPVQAAEISLDLAGILHRAGDAEAAYGNVQSAATAWKAVRDPLRGLALGRELLTLWTEMAAGEGPAAEDLDKLESARTRMLRLAERARKADQ